MNAQVTISVRAEGFGFTKTLPFSKEGLDKLRELVDFIETQLPREKEEVET